MKITTIAAVAALGMAVSGCATIVGEGTTQNISVMSDPPGATCIFYSQGQPVGTIQNTPGNLIVRRTKYDMTIKCNKPGYNQAEYFNKSGLNSLVAANVAADLLLTAGISSIVDSASGADNEYTGTVVIGLTPTGTVPAAPPPAPAAAPKTGT
jgi:hypothetical protein